MRARHTLASIAVLSGVARAQHELYSFVGDPGELFGSAVANAGDVDLDGIEDVVVGAYVGRYARMHSGANGAVLLTVSDPAAERFGWAVAGVGDIDHDGHADVVVGAPYFDPGGSVQRGKVAAYSGASGALLWSVEGMSSGDELGRSVSGLADVDGDTIPDVIAGAPFGNAGGVDSGYAWVLSGVDGALIRQVAGLSLGDRLGWSVADGGDMDGVSGPELLLGATSADPGGNGTGAAYVVSAADGSFVHQFAGLAVGDGMGGAVARIADLDGGGRPDWIVGAAADDTAAGNGGRVVVLSGETGLLLHSFVGTEPSGHFGSSVASAGDLDGDGIEDILVGAPDEDELGIIDAGTVSVFSGANFERIGFAWGDVQNDRLGFAVCGGLALDADPRAEFIATARDADPNGIGSGLARVYTQPCPGATNYCTGAPNSMGAGASISYVGSLEIQANDLVLLATDAVPNQFGIFFYGPIQQQLPLGDGFLCLHPGALGLFRLYPPIAAGPSGGVARFVDLGQPPASNGPGEITAGSTWNFQFWYRDPSGPGGSGFNFSNGLAVRFCP